MILFSGFNQIKSIFDLNVTKSLNVSSLSTPRTPYKKTEVNKLAPKTVLDIAQFREAFFDSFKALYSETDVENILNETIKVGETKDVYAFIKNDAEKDDILKLLYVVVYATGMSEYEITETQDYVETEKFILKNFNIRRRK